ncbi:MAG: hypothetical protein ACP5Q4_09725 [Candidatus Caldatribacteriaceae bacterium]
MSKERTEPDAKCAFWKGIPREAIDWYPAIDESKCVLHTVNRQKGTREEKKTIETTGTAFPAYL